MLVVFGLAFGVVLSWSVGLAPALIYRYVIYKAPIAPAKVFVRLAPIVGVLMFAYKIGMASITETRMSGNPLPWIIMYFVGQVDHDERPDNSVTDRNEPAASNKGD